MNKLDLGRAHALKSSPSYSHSQNQWRYLVKCFSSLPLSVVKIINLRQKLQNRKGYTESLKFDRGCLFSRSLSLQFEETGSLVR